MFDRYLLYWLVIFFAFISFSCKDESVGPQTKYQILHINELLLDVTYDSSGYYSKDTIWVYRDNTLNNVEISFIGETDTLTQDCMANISIYYFIDSVHYHIFTYSQFGRDSVNKTHNVSVNIQNYRNEMINYEFLVFITKLNNLQIPQYIRLKDINIYEVR